MPASARILEIGDFHYVKAQYPERTTLLWTGGRSPLLDRSQYFDCTAARFLGAIADVRAGRYDLVVVYMGLRSPWHPRNWLRALAAEPMRPLPALSRVFGVSWLRFVSIPAPLVVLDMNDAFILGRHNFFLLDQADLVFKRELPVDRWHILCHSLHPRLPTRRIRRQRRWQERLAKIQPIALPSPVIDTGAPRHGEFPEKTTDVFFSGNVAENSWVRRTGMAELEELARRGIKVDVPAERLPPEEFRRRLARAWLAWSPSGFSWECFRTSEAAQCLSVPVLNYPTVELHRPLVDGRHVIYYNPEPGGLVRAVETALVDKQKLERMAIAAREHVLRYHTPRALVDYVIECGLQSGCRPEVRGH
jgi:glycosyltransferase involved in cell wall biosynthesis